MTMVVVCLLFSANLSAQMGFVRVVGKARQNGGPLSNVTITITAPGAPSQTVASKDNGTYDFNLVLQKNYTLTFSKYGVVTKVVEFNTTVPGDMTDIIFENEFSLDFIEDIAGVSQDNSMNKPVAKLSYNPTYEDFVHDANYSRQIKEEQTLAKRAAEELKRQQDRARLDSLNKIWNDSLVNAKDREAKLAVLRAEQEKARKDSLAKAQQQAQMAAAAAAREKAQQDSIARAQAEALRLQEIAAFREKSRLDSLAKAEREKQRLDSISAVRAAAEAKAKAEEEARLREKSRQDSLAAVAKLEADRKKQEAEAKIQLELLAKQRQDSITRAEAALKVRQKEIADSTQKANAALALQQAEARKQQEIELKAQEKARQDSMALAAQLAKERQKFVADSTQKAKDELAAAQAREKAQLAAAEKARQDSVKQAEVALAEQQAAEKSRLVAAEKARKDSIQNAAAAEKARNAELALQREQSRKDSLAGVERERAESLALKSRNDSISKAQAELKARLDAEAEAKAEQERKEMLVAEKARQDSIYLAQQAAAEQAEAERKAKAYADIEAKKQLMSKSAEAGGEIKSAAKVSAAPVAKIVDSDYKEGVTEEPKITENNRTIQRVIVKKDGTTSVYQKVVYNYGGVFYFKDDASITQTTYDQEIKLAKAALKK
ncbi:MAG: hypothetical protein RIQ47_40 [Bacteroidota bacterium]